MAILFETAKPISESVAMVNPPSYLTFGELDQICLKNNIVVMNCSNACFDFESMKFAGNNPLDKQFSNTDPLLKFICVKSLSFDSLEQFFSEAWNDKDLFFFYSGTKVQMKSEKTQQWVTKYILRISVVESSKIEKAVKRHEAITRIRVNMNYMLRSKEDIIEYVNSEVFKSDCDDANISKVDISKELWDAMKDATCVTTQENSKSFIEQKAKTEESLIETIMLPPQIKTSKILEGIENVAPDMIESVDITFKKPVSEDDQEKNELSRSQQIQKTENNEN